MGLVGLGDATERLSTVHAVDESVTLHLTDDRWDLRGSVVPVHDNPRRPIGVTSMVDVSAGIEFQDRSVGGPRCIALRPGTVPCDVTSRRRLLIEKLVRPDSEIGADMTMYVWKMTLSAPACAGPASPVGNRDHREPGRRVKFGRTATTSRSIGTRPRMEARLGLSPD